MKIFMDGKLETVIFALAALAAVAIAFHAGFETGRVCYRTFLAPVPAEHHYERFSPETPPPGVHRI